jgi:hypothetical protein
VSDKPLVDAVIAVHDASRPVARAVGSLADSGLVLGEELRVSVVCHNIAVEAIADAIPDDLAARIRFLELRDSIPSAAGPFTAGIHAATAPYVSIMGSDDRLEPGALASWLAHTDGGAVDAVVAPQVHADGSAVRTPPTRPFRRGDLDPVKDRLAYRTAPLGLISRSAVDRLSLGFPAGLRTGEDQSFSAHLWFGGGRVVYARRAPRYVVGADATTRVSTSSRALADEFEFIARLIAEPWYRERPLEVRRAIAVKMVRIHVFAGSLARIESQQWTDEDHSAVSGLVTDLRGVAEGFERPFSIADRDALDALTATESSSTAIADLLRARRRFGRPRTLVTRDLAGMFAVEGPLRFMAASALL